jgi:CHAT domain-containing protein/Tfp pilus assembly protein PilF
MRYSLGLLAFAGVFLVTFPVEAVVKDGLSVASEEVKIAQGEGREQRNDEALRLTKLGTQQLNRGEYRKALNNFEQALVIVREIGEPLGESTILNYIGKTYLSLAEYDKALDYYQQALVIFKQIGNKVGEGTTLNNIGEVYRSLAEYAKALDYYEQALAIHKQVGNKLMEGTALNGIGEVYSNLGEYAKALNYYQQGLAIFKQVGNKLMEGTALNGIGNVYRGLGEYAKALNYCQQALAIFKQVGDKSREGITLNGIGNIYNNVGKYAKALDYYQQALVIVKQVSYKAGEGITLNNIGSVYRSLGEYVKALDYYQQALVIVKQVSYKAGEGITFNNIGDVYASFGEYAKALDYYKQALAIHQQVGNKPMEGTTLNNIGIVHNDLEKYTKTLDYLQQALAIHKQVGNKPMEGTTLNNIGKVYYSLGEYTKVLDYYQQALAIFKKVGDKSREGNILNNIGALYKITGKYAEAEKNLFAAIKILESLRPGLTDDQKISIFETQSGTYGLLQDILIAQNKTTTALEISERSKARALVELLSSKFNPNQQLNIKPPNIEQIKQIARQQKATFVEYSVIGKSQLYIWVIKPTGEVTFKQVDIKSLDTPLTELVKNSRASIGARGRAGIDVVPVKNPVNQKQNLQKLHELLIKPIASHLPTNPDDRVIFIPHESLFLVPFPALMDASGKYLIEKHTIMTAPAIQVLELTNKNNPGKLNFNSLQPKDLLVVGNPTMPIVGIPPVQLSPLKGAETEAKAIAKLFNTTALTGNQATKSTVLEKISSARVIHLATHGLLDGKDFGELTPGAIALAPDKFNNSDKLSDVNEGLLKTTEIIDLKLNADLVVLSACDTGRGQITGDGVIGLSRSLITAGASSVIVSLWKIPDDSTSELMTEFYRQWEQTGDKAKALRNAMLITMKTNPEPIDWAAFTLIGEAE